MKQDLDKIEEIRLDAEKLFERLSLTVQSITSNYMDLKTLLLEKEVIDYKLEAADKEHEIKNNLTRPFSSLDLKIKRSPDQPYSVYNREYPAYEISADISSRFSSLISGVFGNEYFDALSVFHKHLTLLQSQIGKGVGEVEGNNPFRDDKHFQQKGLEIPLGVYDGCAPDKSCSARFELLHNRYVSMQSTLSAISEAEIWEDGDPEFKQEFPQSEIWHSALCCGLKYCMQAAFCQCSQVYLS